LKEIIYKDPILPSQWNPSIPPMLEYITLKSLEKKQQKRYASALLMEKDLIKFLQNTDQKKPSLYLYKKQYKKHFQKIIIFSVCLIFILIGYFYFPSFPSQQKTTKNLSMIILCENVFSQLQTQFSMHIDHIQEACNDPSVYTDLFKNITETTQYKNIKNNERYSHNLEQRLQQTPWDATLYKESAFLLTEMAKMYFENHQKEKAKEYQKKAEKKLRIYFSIRPYNRKIFTQFAEPYMYILNSNTLKEDLYVSQEFFNVSTLSLGILKFSDLFPYLEICTTYLQKEKSTWNRDKFELCKKLFQNKDHNILLQNILTPLLLAPEFCKLYQEDKEIRELFQQKREQAIQNHDIQKPIKQLLAYYYLTRDTEYLSYIFTYTNKYIPTLHYILNQDEEYFFRFLAAYVLSICKEEKARDALEETMENDENNLDSAILSYICAKKMNPQMEHPSFLNDIPTNIADTTKLIFLQYILEISDKEKKSDITDKYISPYIQDKNPNIILLAMYFMLKTLAPEYPQKLELKTPKQKQEYAEQNKEYAKNIQQIWEIIKAQEERHILLFLSLANKFFNVIEPIYAIDKNIITDIQSILEQTQNPDIQENALKFLQYYLADKYETIARTWLQKEYLEESVQLFLISSIENNLEHLTDNLLNKDISLFNKLSILESMIKAKTNSIFNENEYNKDMVFVIKLVNDIIDYIKMIETLIWHKNMDNNSKPFFIYLLSALPNISLVYDIKIKLLDSENEEAQKAILLGLSTYPFLGHYYSEISFMKPRKLQGKRAAGKKKEYNTNNQAMFQEDIQDKLNTV
ncbi:MAG TPA: hypothetical protein PKM32_04565, partial [Planctomycetota bacterium]|nr:hypothetical protein [Planctomycetota bacterium]